MQNNKDGSWKILRQAAHQGLQSFYSSHGAADHDNITFRHAGLRPSLTTLYKMPEGMGLMPLNEGCRTELGAAFAALCNKIFGLLYQVSGALYC